jgi:hypothetical protein
MISCRTDWGMMMGDLEVQPRPFVRFGCMMASFLVWGHVILLFLRSRGRRSSKMCDDAVEMYGVFLL